nr:immunoglobulin heavy chain junction region [Mus musculus]
CVRGGNYKAFDYW